MESATLTPSSFLCVCGCESPLVPLQQALLKQIKDAAGQPVSGSLSMRELRSCAICQEPFGEKALRLPCAHHFHKECVEKWLQKNTSCPLCRHIIPTPSVDDQAFWRQEFRVAERIMSQDCKVDMFG